MSGRHSRTLQDSIASAKQERRNMSYLLERELFEDYLEFDDSPEHEVIGRDSRVRETKTTDAPFRYICNLEYDGQAICTGTLIGPRTVLTAGHCLDGLSPSRMRVIPGRNGTLEPLPATQAAQFFLAPGYSEVSPTDYGIIRLHDPIGNLVGYWSRTYRRTQQDPIGTSISAAPLPLQAGVLRLNISGYPSDKPSDRSWGCRGSNPNRICGTYQYRAYERTVRSKDGMLHYLNDTFPGHSGSPVWVRRHPSMGGRVLVGIHVGGDDSSTRGVSNRAVRINDSIVRFITANTI